MPQFDAFGAVRPGAMGDCLKHRSSGWVERYNNFTLDCDIAPNLMDSTRGQALTWGDAAKGICPEVVLFNLNVASAVAEATNNDFHALPSTAGMAGKVQVMSFGRGTVNMANNGV